MFCTKFLAAFFVQNGHFFIGPLLPMPTHLSTPCPHGIQVIPDAECGREQILAPGRFTDFPVHNAVYDKENNPFISPCSSKAHLVTARSNRSSRISIGKQPSLPGIFESPTKVNNNFSFICSSIGNDRTPVYARCRPRSNACYRCKSWVSWFAPSW